MERNLGLEDIMVHGIGAGPVRCGTSTSDGLDEVDKVEAPAATSGSEEEIEIDGQPVRARIYPWGIAEVDNPQHSDFSRLRSALLKYVISC